MQLGLISDSFHKKRVEKSKLFQSKWSNAFQIQIGIDLLRSWGVEGDGQTIKVKEGVFCIRSYLSERNQYTLIRSIEEWREWRT